MILLGSSQGPAIQYSYRIGNSVQAGLILTFDTTLGTYIRDPTGMFLNQHCKYRTSNRHGSNFEPYHF